MQKEYWRLSGLHELDQLHDEIGDDIFQFRRTHNTIKDEGYTTHQLIEVADHLDELPLLRSEHQQLEKENESIVDERDQLNESTIIAKQDLSAINKTQGHLIDNR